MKKSFFAIVAFCIVGISLVFQNTITYSNPSGAPERSSGSPFDGQTCANSNCHNGTASVRSGMITSTVPASGYIPSTEYTFTVSITQAGINKFGFAISPQNAAGNVVGTLALTNTTETQMKSSGNYVTHRTAGNSGVNTKSWSFNWTAPSVGTGSVPFYASVMAANNNTDELGDLTFADVLTVQEDITTQIDETSSDVDFSVFPNPVYGNSVQVSFNANASSTSRIRIMGLNGSVVNEINHRATSNGNQHAELSMENWEKGVYFVEIQNGLGRNMTRIIRH
jgi:hypothetical protein